MTDAALPIIKRQKLETKQKTLKTFLINTSKIGEISEYFGNCAPEALQLLLNEHSQPIISEDSYHEMSEKAQEAWNSGSECACTNLQTIFNERLKTKNENIKVINDENLTRSLIDLFDEKFPISSILPQSICGTFVALINTEDKTGHSIIILKDLEGNILIIDNSSEAGGIIPEDKISDYLRNGNFTTAIVPLNSPVSSPVSSQVSSQDYSQASGSNKKLKKKTNKKKFKSRRKSRRRSRRRYNKYYIKNY